MPTRCISDSMADCLFAGAGQIEPGSQKADRVLDFIEGVVTGRDDDITLRPATASRLLRAGVKPERREWL